MESKKAYITQCYGRVAELEVCDEMSRNKYIYLSYESAYEYVMENGRQLAASPYKKFIFAKINSTSDFDPSYFFIANTALLFIESQQL